MLLGAGQRERFPALKEWRFQSASIGWGYTILEFSNDPYDMTLEFNDNVMLYFPEDNTYKANISSNEFDLLNKKSFQEILGTIGGGQRNEFPYFVSTYNDNYISMLSLRLIGMFMLSSLVRYRPQTWIHSLSHMATQNRVLDDQLLALIEQFIQGSVGDFVDTTQVICGVKHS